MAYRIHAKVKIDATRLRAVRIERKLTQQSLAKQAGMPFTTVNRIESEVYRSVEIITKRALEAVLGVDLTPSRWPTVAKGNLPRGGRSPAPTRAGDEVWSCNDTPLRSARLDFTPPHPPDSQRARLHQEVD